MFQPEPTAYLPLSTGYGFGHGLPEFTFQETPLLSGSGGGGGGGIPGNSGGRGGAAGVGGAGVLPGASGGLGSACGGAGGGYVGIGGGSGTVGAGNSAGAGTAGGAATTAPSAALIYTTPIFSPNTATIGPASGPFSFHTTSSSHHNHNHNHQQHQHQHHHSSHNQTRIKMEPNTDDLAAQEAAAREYQPQIKGPLVGEKLPSTAITEEYAKADPVYIQKTLTLPQRYSEYRPIQGDGNCGWRAIGFGWLEALIFRGDKSLVEAEKLRMTSLNDYIEKVGEVSTFVFLDMSEETIELLGRISDALPDRGRAMAELMTAFNTQAVSDSIVYHLRLLASSFLKEHRIDYAPFVEHDGGVDAYCETILQQHGREIDHIGLAVLVDALLKPIDFALEVAYLDRSPGTHVNTFLFPEQVRERDPSTLGAIIHLLFRPDHYDVLYPPPPLQPPVDIQVHRVDTFHSGFVARPVMGIPDYSSPDLQALSSMIPNFGGPSPGLAPFMDATAGSPLTSYTSSPGSTWMPSPFVEAAQPQPPPVPVAVPAPAPALQNYPLRLSEYCQMPEYVENVNNREPTFQTSTFRNSHFNVAHYNNPNFQPEEYRPENDDCDLPPTKGSGRKRGSV